MVHLVGMVGTQIFWGSEPEGADRRMTSLRRHPRPGLVRLPSPPLDPAGRCLFPLAALIFGTAPTGTTAPGSPAWLPCSGPPRLRRAEGASEGGHAPPARSRQRAPRDARSLPNPRSSRSRPVTSTTTSPAPHHRGPPRLLSARARGRARRPGRRVPQAELERTPGERTAAPDGGDAARTRGVPLRSVSHEDIGEPGCRHWQSAPWRPAGPAAQVVASPHLLRLSVTRPAQAGSHASR